MITTVKEQSRIHFEKGKLNVKNDMYYLYKLINKQSVWGHEFILVNAMSTHAITLSEDSLYFEEVLPEMEELIIYDYKKINFSIEFDTERLQTLMHSKFGEGHFILDISAKKDLDKIENIHLTAGTGYGLRKYDFSESDLPFEPKECALLLNSLVSIFSPILPLIAYLNKQ